MCACVYMTNSSISYLANSIINGLGSPKHQMNHLILAQALLRDLELET